jgi:hypothetical protein
VKTSGKPRCKLIKTKQMKTKQTKIDRSGAKWLPGAMALAATTGGAQAASVQITLNGNKISTTGGNQLVADLTGDNIVDLSPLVGGSVLGVRRTRKFGHEGAKLSYGGGRGKEIGDHGLGIKGGVRRDSIFGSWSGRRSTQRSVAE